MKTPVTPRERKPRGQSLTMKRVVTEMRGLIKVADESLIRMREICLDHTGSDDVTPLLYLITKMSKWRPALDAQGDLVTPPKGELSETKRLLALASGQVIGKSDPPKGDAL